MVSVFCYICLSMAIDVAFLPDKDGLFKHIASILIPF